MVEKKKKKKKSQTSSKKELFKNPWKIAFLSLVAVLVAFVVVIGYRVSTPRMTYDSKSSETINLKDPILEISMTKDQVTRAVNFYTKDLFEKSGVDYTFHLDKEALLDGTFSLLGHDTHFYLYFEPFVLSNGDVQLKAKNLTIGSLNVPVSAVMNYISHTVDFPKWVEINSDEKYITLHLQQLTIGKGMKVKAEQINLMNDQIRFNLYLTDKKK